jgi:hypothetical protein
MLAEDGDEAIAVRGLIDMGRFVHNDEFKDVLRLFHSSVDGLGTGREEVMENKSADKYWCRSRDTAYTFIVGLL